MKLYEHDSELLYGGEKAGRDRKNTQLRSNPLKQYEKSNTPQYTTVGGKTKNASPIIHCAVAIKQIDFWCFYLFYIRDSV